MQTRLARDVADAAVDDPSSPGAGGAAGPSLRTGRRPVPRTGRAATGRRDVEVAAAEGAGVHLARDDARRPVEHLPVAPRHRLLRLERRRRHPVKDDRESLRGKGGRLRGHAAATLHPLAAVSFRSGVILMCGRPYGRPRHRIPMHERAPVGDHRLRRQRPARPGASSASTPSCEADCRRLEATLRVGGGCPRTSRINATSPDTSFPLSTMHCGTSRVSLVRPTQAGAMSEFVRSCGEHVLVLRPTGEDERGGAGESGIAPCAQPFVVQTQGRGPLHRAPPQPYPAPPTPRQGCRAAPSSAAGRAGAAAASTPLSDEGAPSAQMLFLEPVETPRSRFSLLELESP